MDAMVSDQLPKAKRDPDVVVELPGPPRGKGSPRSRVATTKGGAQFVATYPDPETRKYESLIRFAGEQAMAGRPPFDCMLRGRITAVFAIPASMSAKRRVEAIAGIVRPTTKPDDDNLLKVRDGLKGIVFRDDALFVESVVRKFYGEKPCWRFECWVHTSLLL